ncbi:MAG: alpha-galactosidase [Acidimicrobiales bacterium]|nr:alpha-galactosidase [Acidimicrobiales bacterium]
MSVVLEPRRVEAEWHTGEAPRSASVGATGSGVYAVGPLEVALRWSPDGSELAWSVGNTSALAVRVRSVALVLDVAGVVEPLRWFAHGYQSWSPSAVRTFGRDRDPSTTPGAVELLRGVHHADQRVARPGELRAEWVTVLADAGGDAPLLVGFDGGDRHDGTLRLRPGAHGPELWLEAFLGDAEIPAGHERALHGVRLVRDGRDADGLLGAWAETVGRTGRARLGAPYQVGWCSWYHYFGDVTEADLRANLALVDDWPFEVFQLDDGYQAAIGDWLRTDDSFPSELDVLADAIARTGRRPGLWLAPFLVAPDSEVARAHPDWLARLPDGSGPMWVWWNPIWGGGQEGFMYGLDTTRPEVVDHLRLLARSLVDAGFTYLKLDFTFAPSFDGTWADPTRTPSERVRAGYAAIRDGAGEDAFLLGCGVPLAHVVGLVDANRIGADVAPLWARSPGTEIVPGYLEIEPATQQAYRNTLTRAFMHRRLWVNDPDCVMLRQEQTELSVDAARTWARAVGVSGGMALVSDDLALLGAPERALFAEVVSRGRASDDEARAGRTPRVPDLLDSTFPRVFEGGGSRLSVDPEAATSSEAPA